MTQPTAAPGEGRGREAGGSEEEASPRPELDGRGSEVLTRDECHGLLERAAGGAGRLGFALEGRITVLPVNYVCSGDDLLLRLGPGSTLEALVAEPAVGFEIDHIDLAGSPVPEAWSVLAQGTAHLVREPFQLGDASALGLTPEVREPGEVYVRIAIERISGRRFPIGALARFHLGRPR